eukprot:TRINITY_DN8604_c0_g1_i4.p1 TRINITY_DN8604_c0_g1~~TRINITY_DN8604_c0_g1_i4.p1  ORF type:complete len:853 (+),score=204.15 TRINITY_DN8604_c0_g1_i4:228-2786(+)
MQGRIPFNTRGESRPPPPVAPPSASMPIPSYPPPSSTFNTAAFSSPFNAGGNGGLADMMDGQPIDDTPLAATKKQLGDTIPFSWFAGVLGGALVFSFLIVSQGSWLLNMFLVLSYAAAGLVFASWLFKWVLAKDSGTPAMRKVSEPIREGSEGFLKTQYTMIFRFALVVAVLLFFLYTNRAPDSTGLPPFSVAVFTAFSFLMGCLCSGISGYVGMYASVRANLRVASVARRSYHECIQVCLRSGAFCGFVVVALTLIGIATLFVIAYLLFGAGPDGSGLKITQVPLLLVGYCFGASFVALFAQLGGGIYTKAADVGADMVGKLEQDIPEDDPRNPAVIADLVGDNVGDCAGRGADLFESISAEIISAMVLGGQFAESAGVEGSGFIMFPLVIHAFDLVLSGLGVITVNTRGGLHDFFGKPIAQLQQFEDPLAILKRGYAVSIVLALIFFTIASRCMLHVPSAPDAWWHFALCGVTGIATAYIFVLITQYYTDYNFAPVRSIVEASKTGHGTNVIAGIGVGLMSTGFSILTVSWAILTTYYLGKTSGITNNEGTVNGGIFGTAVGTLGMLSTAVFILAMDVFGPIADNAGGIVEMSNQPESVRDITDKLDAVGNVTKALTKGYAVGSASLACFLLFSAFMDEVSSFSGTPMTVIDISKPEIYVAGLLGAMLVFVFSALTISAVGNAAQEVVREVRRQFKDRPEIMSGTQLPDYHQCVSIVSARALKEMILPGALAVFFPLVVAWGFKYLGQYTGQSLLGPQCLTSFIMFATSTGILMGMFFNNGGAAWDNAKKYVETGAYGGKGSECHKATITGDTVGDPFKDTAGPSLHVLIKLLSTMSLVIAPFLAAQAIN